MRGNQVQKQRPWIQAIVVLTIIATTITGCCANLESLSDPSSPIVSPQSTRPKPFPTLTPPPQATLCGKPTGYIHLSEDGNYFVYDGGARFVPHGWDANRIWHKTPGVERWRIPEGMDYDSWVAWLKENGVNNFRIRLSEGNHPSYVPGFEPPPIGSYNIWDLPLRYDDVANQIRWDRPIPPGRYEASNITQIVRAAERHGVKLMITFFASEEVTHDWPLSAYNAQGVYPDGNPVPPELQGVITSKSDFWTDSTAIAYQKRRIDFILDNWGDSSAIWAWEVMNESNFAAFSETDIQDMVAWVKMMARYIKARDPHRRPVTVSSIHLWDRQLPTAEATDEDARLTYLRNTMFEGPEIDIVNYHNYTFHTLPGRLAIIRALQARYGKPLLIGEFGLWHWGGRPLKAEEDANLPPSLRVEDALKEADPYEAPPYYNSLEHIWLGVVTLGGNGTAVRWHRFSPNSAPDYLNEPRLYRPAARFMEKVEWASFLQSQPWEDRIHATGMDFVAAQGDGRQVLIMLRGLTDDDPSTPDTQVFIRGLAPGHYEAQVFDWLTGQQDPTRSLSNLVAAEGQVHFPLDMSAYRKKGVGSTGGAATAIIYLRRLESRCVG